MILFVSNPAVNLSYVTFNFSVRLNPQNVMVIITFVFELIFDLSWRFSREQHWDEEKWWNCRSIV